MTPKADGSVDIGLKVVLEIWKSRRVIPMMRLVLLALHLHRILEDAEDMLHLCSCKSPGEKFDQKIVPSVLDLENLLCDFWYTVQEKGDTN